MKMKLQHSRPQKKNDQAHSEQKNDTHVRQLESHKKCKANAIIAAVNDLYENEWSNLNNPAYAHNWPYGFREITS